MKAPPFMVRYPYRCFVHPAAAVRPEKWPGIHGSYPAHGGRVWGFETEADLLAFMTANAAHVNKEQTK